MLEYLSKRLVMSYVALLFSLALSAQVFYYCGFETEVECQAWSFKTASRVTTDFVIGDAIKSTGVKSLYTSHDNGLTAGYDMSGPGYCSMAYTRITFDAGWHNIYFDYKILTGGDYDDIRFMISLVPVSTNINPFATAIGGANFNRNATDGQIFLSDPNREYKRSGWNMESAMFQVNTPGEYYLCFLFKQKGISAKVRFGHPFPDRTGVNIDNIYIEKMLAYGACNTRPTDVAAVKVSNGVKITWNGTPGAEYDLMYYRINGDKTSPIVPDTVKGLTQPEYTLPYATVENGVYTVKVRAVCNDSAGVWAEKTPVIIYGPSDYCIEFWDLDNTNTKCTAGPFGSPFAQRLKIDYGYESRESYHTVHYDTTEYDPVTGYQLKTVLDGHWASVRIGEGAEYGPNDNTPGGPSMRMSSAVTYLYKVPDDAQLFLLNYAPVLQFAAHHPENEQTQIVIDILDQYGGLLDSKCLKSKFNSIRLKLDEVAGVADPGWHNFRPQEGQFGSSGPSSPDEIKWHDWMVMGFNLKDYVGDVVQFRISLDPCGASFHFAYIYLVPVCASAVVEGMSCSENATVFEVPDGFKYRWYKQNDRTRTVVCRDRFFTPEPDDRDSYYVDLMNKEDTTCFFTLEAYILPRTPKPVFSVSQTSENCQNTLTFDASGTCIYELGDDGNYVMVDPAKAKVSNFTWDFGSLGTMVGGKVQCVFPNEGGTFPVTLMCEYGGCTVDTTFNVDVKAISGNTRLYEKTICQGDVYTVNRKNYSEEGIYRDTIIGGSYYGCDSLLEIRLHVIPHTSVDTVIAVTSDDLPYAVRIDGRAYTFKGPKDTTIVVASHELRKCDSIDYNVHFEVTSMLEVELDALPLICGDDEEFTLKYILKAGFFDTIEVRFDSYAANVGFSSDGVELVGNGVLIPMPDGGVRPDFYHVDLIFRNGYGAVPLPVDFTVRYPSSVISQRWNDVLALKNSDNNGGYDFVAYQWYLDDVIAEGFVMSRYYIENKNLDFGHEYTVLLTRADDGKSIMTCPFVPVENVEGSMYSEDILVLFGTEIVKVQMPKSAKAYMYGSSGVEIAVWDFVEGENTIVLPDSHGVYLLKVVFPDGRAITRKLVR